MTVIDYKKGVVITATELKQNLGRYLDYVEQQNDVVITKNGIKTARLTPYVTDIEQYFTVREAVLDHQYGDKKVSYEEFMEIYEKSTLRMEFINGEIHILSSPTIDHQEILGKLYILFSMYFKDKKCKVFMAPFDVHFKKKDIKTPDVMQPDILVACDMENNVNEKRRYMGTPSLVAEILSDNTRSRDMVEKLNTYMTSGVKEYWVVDPRIEKIMIYDFIDFGIGNYMVYAGKEKTCSLVFEGLTIETWKLFSDMEWYKND
jgi:prevent-host-death family protein